MRWENEQTRLSVQVLNPASPNTVQQEDQASGIRRTPAVSIRTWGSTDRRSDRSAKPSSPYFAVRPGVFGPLFLELHMLLQDLGHFRR